MILSKMKILNKLLQLRKTSKVTYPTMHKSMKPKNLKNQRSYLSQNQTHHKYQHIN